jgi:hypothetical protein
MFKVGGSKRNNALSNDPYVYDFFGLLVDVGWIVRIGDRLIKTHMAIICRKEL